MHLNRFTQSKQGHAWKGTTEENLSSRDYGLTPCPIWMILKINSFACIYLCPIFYLFTQ